MGAGLLAHDLVFEGLGYRRRNNKTKKTVSTLFGNITLWRRGYREWQGQEGSIVPW